MGKRFLFMVFLAHFGLGSAACDEKKEERDADQEEWDAEQDVDQEEPPCPGSPPSGACSFPGQSCDYEWICGTIGCWCSDDGYWICSGGHYCPDADTVDEPDVVEDVPDEEASDLIEEDVVDDFACPGDPPLGLTCDAIGVSCDYDTDCGLMSCTCILGGTWSCVGGDDCPDEEEAEETEDAAEAEDAPSE